MPNFANACAGHSVIAMHDDVGDIARDWLASIASAARTAFRTNGREPMVTIALGGGGLACLPRIMGDSHAGLRRIATPRPAPQPALWLGVHRDARQIPRVRTVIAHLVRELRHRQPALAPRS
jgi:DNA-binding transcriptional LysR family regulator